MSRTLIWGMEEAPVKCVNESFFISTKLYGPVNIILPWRPSASNSNICCCARRSELLKKLDGKYSRTIETLSKELPPADMSLPEKVWIHKSCSISRAKVRQSCKISPRPGKDAVAVIPKPEHVCSIAEKALYVDSQDGTVYVWPEYGNPSRFTSCPCGETFMDMALRYAAEKLPGMQTGLINPSLGRSVCVYCGPVYYTTSHDTGLLVIADGLCSSWMTEDRLNALLDSEPGASKPPLDAGRLTELITLISAKDIHTASLGVNTLAALDWQSAPSAALWLLKRSTHEFNHLVLSSDALFMLKILSPQNRANALNRITCKEWERSSDVLETIIKIEAGKEIRRALKSVTNACVTLRDDTLLVFGPATDPANSSF